MDFLPFNRALILNAEFALDISYRDFGMARLVVVVEYPRLEVNPSMDACHSLVPCQVGKVPRPTLKPGRSTGREPWRVGLSRTINYLRPPGGARYREDGNKAKDSRKFPETVESEFARTMLMESRCLTSTCPMRYFS